MSTVLLVHGWGFEPRFWDPLRARLEGLTVATVDLGFFTAGHCPQVERPLVVAHSLGFAWALANLPRPWAGAVAVNAFPRFTRAADFPHGVAGRVLERMLARFAVAPQAVAGDFLARCGVAQPAVEGVRAMPAGEALAWLAVCDERRALAELDCPLVALAGDADPVVTAAMSRDAFAGRRLEMVKDGGHLLPLSHPDRVAELVRAMA
ncbi:MAG: alpha/beta fold hydrolase [Magnetospirillum sp.]|nr:alpha/beta fold hydrolase [Magnetospirillum sp.]